MRNTQVKEWSAGPRRDGERSSLHFDQSGRAPMKVHVVEPHLSRRITSKVERRLALTGHVFKQQSIPLLGGLPDHVLEERGSEDPVRKIGNTGLNGRLAEPVIHKAKDPVGIYAVNRGIR